MALDFMPKRNLVEVILPADAGPVFPNSGVGAAYGVWVQVVAASAAPYVLCAAHIAEQFQVPPGVPSLTTYQLEVGIGAAGFEVPVAASASYIVGLPGFAAGIAIIAASKTLFFEPIVIPAGTRIAVRAWGNGAIAVLFGVYLVCYDASDYELPGELMSRPHERYMKGLTSAAQGAVCFPTAGVTAVTTAGGGFGGGYGAWVAMTAAAPNDVLVTGLVCGDSLVGAGFAQTQIGIGAAGLEVVGGKVGMAARTLGPVSTSLMPRPIFAKRNERIAVRTEGGGGAPVAFDMILLGHEMR